VKGFTFLISMFLVLFLKPIIAANVVFDISESDSYVFEYTPVKSEKTEVNNFFIKELAKYNLTSLYKTRFTYHFSINRKVSEIDDHTFEVTAELSSEKCTGDIYYKEFNISDILMPEIAEFTIIVEDNGNYVVKREFKDVGLNKDKKFNAVFQFEVLDNSKNFTFRFEDVKFYSSPSDKKSFFDRISYIDSYYAANSALNDIFKQYENIDLTPAYLPETFMNLQEMERLYTKIAGSSFYEQLSLSDQQGKTIADNLQKVKTRIYNHQSRYNKLLNALEYIRLELRLESMAKDYVDEVAEFCHLSQDITYSYHDYYYDLGMVNYNSSYLYSFKSGLNSILLKTKYCNDTDLVLQRLKQEVYKAFLHKSEDLILEEQYHLAKGILINAENFYTSSYGKTTGLDLNIQISKANYGIYNSYLHLIDRAIDIGNYELAENYIEKAKAFQASHSSTIISTHFINRVSEDLVKLYINKGISQNQDEEFEQARYCFEQAHLVCKNLGKFNHDYIIKHGLIEARNGLYLQYINKAQDNLKLGNDKEAKGFLRRAEDLATTYPSQIADSPDFSVIQSELDYQVYLKNISEGKKYLANGNYNQAYFKLLDALLLEEVSDFEIYDPLVDVFAEAAVPYLVSQCKLGEVKVIKNKLDEARYIYNECLTLQNEYGLDFEQDLQASLVLLNNGIFAKQCEITSFQFQELLSQFNDAVECGDFIMAIDVLDETKKISKANYYCEFDVSIINDLQADYGPAAEYQELASEAQKALESNDHKRFSEIYGKMEELSERYEVIRKRIEPLPLHYLFSIKKNLAFLESSLNDYESQEEFETALRILQVMEAGDVPGKDAKGIQQKLAQKMATADKATADNSDPKANLEKYTNGSSWYKHFKKAYIKNW